MKKKRKGGRERRYDKPQSLQKKCFSQESVRKETTKKKEAEKKFMKNFDFVEAKAFGFDEASERGRERKGKERESREMFSLKG